VAKFIHSFIHSSIHSFIWDIYIAPLPAIYTEELK